MNIGLARVTISAPQRRIDVALPEHVPLAELLPEVLQHAGEGLADDGERHGGWLLRRTDGATLTTAQGLHPQGVRDGEVLHLVPAQQDWPELDYDDVTEEVAAGARRRGAVWTPASTRAATRFASLVPLAVGLLAVLAAGPRWGGSAYLALGVGVLLAVVSAAASRAYGDAPAGVVLGAAGMPYAFVGGALLLASDQRVGVVGPLPWLGDAELLVGSVMLLVLAGFAGAGVGAALRIFAAGITVGTLGAVAALVGMLSTAAGAAAALIAGLVCGVGLVPLLAVRFGRLPTPPVTLPGGSAAEGFTGGQPPDAARDKPDRSAVYAAVSRTEEVLTGMLIGHAVLAGVAFAVLATSDGVAVRILTGVSAVALLLRSRLFVTTRQRAPLICGGLAGVAVFGVDLLAGAGTGTWVALAGAGVLAAVITVSAGVTYSRRPPTPYMGRAADWLDALTVVSVIPVACAVVGLYDAVSGIGF